MMFSLVANVGAVVVDLTPYYAKPGEAVPILSWNIVGPAGGATFRKATIDYTGDDPFDVDHANLYINDILVETMYGPEGEFNPEYFIGEGLTITVKLEFVLSTTAVHGNHVDGKVVFYTMFPTGAPGTDTQPIDPEGYTIICASELEITSDPLTLTAGTKGMMTVGIFDIFGVPQTVGEFVVNLASDSSGHLFYDEDMTTVITSITIADGASSGTFYYYDEVAGTPTITVSDAAAIMLPYEQVQTVKPAALDSLTIEGEPDEIVAGTQFSDPIVVTAYDEFNNVKTDYEGTVYFSSTDIGETDLPDDYTFTLGDAGIHSFAGSEFVLKTAGTQTITVSNPAITATTGDITVNPAPASKLVFTAAPTSTTAGDEVGPFTVQRLDPYDNPVTSGALVVDLVSTSDGLAAEFRAISGGSPVTYVTILDTESTVDFYYYDEKAGVWTITASAGGLIAETDLTINPAVAYDLKITSDPLVLTAGTKGTMTVEIQDAFGNPQPDGQYVVSLASDSSEHLFYATGTLNVITSITIPDGVSSGTFDYYDEKVGTPTITVSDGLNSDSQLQTVNIGILHHFTIAGEPPMTVAGTSFPASIVVTAYDEFDNVKTDYTGKVTFTSTDPTADLPGDYTFTSGDAGDHEFAGGGFVLYTAGPRTITVADGGIEVTTGTITVWAGPPAIFIVEAAGVTTPIDVEAGGFIPITAQLADMYGNPVAMVGIPVELYVTDVVGAPGILVPPTAVTDVEGKIGISMPITYTVSTHAGDSATITVVAMPIASGTSAVITTIPAPASKLVFTATLPSTTAGVVVGPFTVQRQDPYDNPVTSGALIVELDSTSDGLAAEFRATSGGTPVTYVTILDTESTVDFYYYDEKAGVWTITASATALDSAETVLTVGLADVDHFEVSAASPQTAGIQFDVTITAIDLYGNVKTDYDPAEPYDWTTTANNAPDGTPPVIGTLAAADFVDGVAVKPVTLYCAEAGVEFTATDADLITGTSDPITVDTTEATHLNVYGILDPVTAGVDSGVTVEALDEFDNRATGYTGTIQFASSDTGTATTLPGEYTFTAGDAGIKEFTDGVILTTAGEQWVSATDKMHATIAGEQIDITVNPEVAYMLKITSDPLTLTAGTSGTMTVQVQDEFGNAQPAGEYVIDLASSSSGTYHFYEEGTVTIITSITIPNGESIGTFDYNDPLVGTPTVTVSDVLFSDSQEQTINPAAALKLQILVPGETAAPGTTTGKTGSPTAQEVGQPFDVVVNAVDEYWNINPAGVAMVEITTTDPGAIEPAQAGLVDGTETFSVTFLTMGTWTITAADIDLVPLLADTSPPITVNPGPATHLHVYGITDPVTAGVDSGVTVEAMDEFDNRATGYTGTIQFASSDTGTATTLPGEYTFTALDDGIKVFTDGVILTTAGEQWVSATDAYIEYSYSTNIDIEGSDSDLVLTVTDEPDWVTWTFDFPVEEFIGDGNLNVGLIIALDGEGEGPAFQIHNNDGCDDSFADGTWLYSPWGPAITDGWFGWHSGDTNTEVSTLSWVEATGDRKGQGTDGILQIKIERAILGDEFHWAASPTVGSGFYAPVYDVTMQLPTAFDWGTPIVTMYIPNYMQGLPVTIWGKQIDITVVPAVPAYVDVEAEYSAPMSISLNADHVDWPRDGQYSEWNSPENALTSDDQNAFLTYADADPYEIGMVLFFEDPPEALDVYEITSVKLHIEQQLISDLWAVTEDSWLFEIGSESDDPEDYDEEFARVGTMMENELSIDITEAIDDLDWEYIAEIAVAVYPEYTLTPMGEWYIDNVWIEVNYVYSAEGPSITVPVGGEAMITATVTDAFDNLVSETKVSFETDFGTLHPLTDLTEDGEATTTLSSTDVGTATVTATAGEVGNCDVTFVTHTLDIELSPGWNLISVPRELDDSTIETVFAGITTIEKVYTYHEGKWYAAYYDGVAWITPTSVDPIEDIDDGKGYWVYASEPKTVTISLKPMGYVDATPPDYALTGGWTMIGYTTLQLEPEMPVPVYLTNLDGVWQSLYRYTPAPVGYEQAKPPDYGFKYTELGRGYWIYLNAPGTLVP